jgi:hypothetical protein
MRGEETRNEYTGSFIEDSQNKLKAIQEKNFAGKKMASKSSRNPNYAANS